MLPRDGARFRSPLGEFVESAAHQVGLDSLVPPRLLTPCSTGEAISRYGG
jgi:hypothetical protein